MGLVEAKKEKQGGLDLPASGCRLTGGGLCSSPLATPARELSPDHWKSNHISRSSNTKFMIAREKSEFDE
jgi:hypothetical protein